MEKLQFISYQTEKFTHLETVQRACEAGVKWVQLRVKDQNPTDLVKLAKQAKTICDHYNVKLVINDHPLIAAEIGAFGLHVGKEDMPVKEARKIAGVNCIIGSTANTLDDILMHHDDGADYVGVGPFRFTSTKKKLGPILGIESYEKIMNELRRRNISIPVIAIGGIELEDIKGILKTGVYGIAVSSLLTNSENMKETVSSVSRIMNEINITAC